MGKIFQYNELSNPSKICWQLSFLISLEFEGFKVCLVDVLSYLLFEGLRQALHKYFQLVTHCYCPHNADIITIYCVVLCNQVFHSQRAV